MNPAPPPTALRPASAAPAALASNSARLNNFDFLRFLLAVVVIQTHSFGMFGLHYRGLLSRLLHGELGGAWLAVDGFFAISGFLITASWLKSPSTAKYFEKRARRIYPGFIVSILFCVLIVGPLAGADLATYFRDPQTYSFFQPLVLGPVGSLPGAFQSVPWKGVVNASLWTIRFELFCYILLALLGLATLLRRRKIILALFLLSVAAQTAQQLQWPTTWNLVTPFFGDLWEIVRFITFFLAGVTFYLYRERIPIDARLAALSFLLLAVAFFTHLSTPVLPFCGVYLLFYVAFSPHIPLHHFGRHGDFSYGMYLYAFPVQQLLVYYFHGFHSPNLLTLAALPPTFLLAFLSWHLIEKPFLSRRNRATHEPAPQPSPQPTVLADRSVSPASSL